MRTLKIVSFLAENRDVIIVTFEIFWIAVFLLQAASAASGPPVAGFVYANF